MKKLTDETVAKALGWEWKAASDWPWRKRGCEEWASRDALPKYTTSLDAITAEIEALGLKWSHEGPWLKVTTREPVMHCAEVFFSREDKEGHGPQTCRAATAPLALCAALLAYLKETR